MQRTFQSAFVVTRDRLQKPFGVFVQLDERPCAFVHLALDRVGHKRVITNEAPRDVYTTRCNADGLPRGFDIAH